MDDGHHRSAFNGAPILKFALIEALLLSTLDWQEAS
jgi:hypothetical protein